MRNNIVLANLPKSGLANKLLVWARALVFAKENNYKLYVIGWFDFKIGPILRKEKTKRFYYKYFSSKYKPNLLNLFIMLFFYEKIKDPFLCRKFKKQKILYIFNQIPPWNNYFEGLRLNRKFIRESFINMLASQYKEIYYNCDTPVIGVHIRCSDFIIDNKNLGKRPNVRTPINYFIEIIRKIRKSVNRNLPVTVFTDGENSEVSQIKMIGNVFFQNSKSDLEDMIKLSKSKIIITSCNSTFSYWAAFISSSPVITHPNHKIDIKGDEDNIFEGSINLKYPLNKKLQNYLLKI